MSRYAAMFERLSGEGAFGAFLMLGDPDLADQRAACSTRWSRAART